MALEASLQQLAIDSVVFTAILGAIVALAIFLIREFWTEPNRSTKALLRANLQEKVAAYGKVLTMLESFEKRAKQYPQQTGALTWPHLFWIDELTNLRNAIESSRHLLSDEITDSWVSTISKFNFKTKNTQFDGEQYYYEDMRDFHKLVSDQYSNLRGRYDLLFEGNLDKSRVGSNRWAGKGWRIAFAIVVSAVVFGTIVTIVLQLSEVVITKDLSVPYFVTINNPDNPNELMLMSMELTSEKTGFIAAQREIAVHAELYPNHLLRNEGGFGYSDLPSNYTIMFQGTNCGETEFTILGSSTDACFVHLENESVIARATNPEGVNFIGDGKVIFTTGGQFGILLGTNFDRNTGTAVAMTSNSTFINISPFEVSRGLELSEKTLYMTILLAMIGASLSFIPLLLRKDSR